jgi:hypothetical protein
MTMTADQTPRQNAEGSPCPPWCATDHEKWAFHDSEWIEVEAPQYASNYVRAIRYSDDAAPVLAVTVLSVPLEEAGYLAKLIEGLATATPDQHRNLAAAIRQAAAVITDANGAQS